MSIPRLGLKDALAQVLEPGGKIVIDVGCGDGAMARHLTRLGARVMGVEVSESQLQRARAAEAAGGETYHLGRGENLPFEDATAGAVLYVNSFHHLPIDEMGRALAECARVLKPAGQLIVFEPLAAGGYFEAMRIIEDETEVRAAAYRLLLPPPDGLIPEGELFYETILRFRGPEHFIKAVTAADPARRVRLPLVEADLHRGFATHAQRDEEGFYFILPMRRNCFRKAPGRCLQAHPRH